jgi:hypothetical protein
MPAEAELILFGIQAAMRINTQFRHAYADSTRSRALTLPLPNFPAETNLSTVENWYRNGPGQPFVVTNLRVKELLNILTETGELTAGWKEEFFQLYNEHFALLNASDNRLVGVGENSAGLTNDDIVPLLTIRQWQEGQDPNPTMLRRMAGTLVNVAVDYFADVPGAISTNTARGKALHSFLQAFDGIDFATDGRTKILEGLFTATLETLRDNAEIISEDERARILVHDVAKGLYEDSRQLVGAAGQTISDKERIGAWTQMVFRSVLKSAGETVFAEPEKFLGVAGAGQSELISGVGQAVLAAVLSKDKVDLGALLTRESLDRVVKAALAAVANHPELVHANSPFLKNLIGTAAGELAQSSVQIGSDFLPEAIRLILESTATHLDLLMPAGPDQPEKHLLVVAAKIVLTQLSAPPPAGGKWTVRFGPEDALKALEAVIAEIVQNPAWLEKRAGDASPLLGEITKAVLDTLRKSATPRLSKDTGIAILKAALCAAGSRLEFLDKDPQGQRLIALAVDAVLATVFRQGTGARAAWILARDASLERLEQIVLEKLARHGVTTASIEKVKKALEATIQQIEQGGVWSWDDLGARLETALA